MIKVLFLVQLPPPVHGASMVNKYIQDSHYVNSKIESKYINISPSYNLSDLGKLSIKKVVLALSIYKECIIQYIRFKPDTVYITLSPHGMGFWKDALILQILKMLGAKAIIHLHGKGIDNEVSKSRVKRLFYKTIFKKTDVIHLSKSLFYDVGKVFDKKQSLLAVNNGVDINYTTDTKNIKSNKITFIYLSNFSKTKGSDTFIDAINMLDKAYEGRFEVKFVGQVSSQSFYHKLLNKIQDRFKDHIEFLGPLYGNDKYRALEKSDIFVLPTKNDCFPLTILEAMSFGLPVLSTFEGAIPDIIDNNVNGFLFDSYDTHALTTRLANYIDNPNLIKEHGRNAREKFNKKYTLEAFEKSFVNALTGKQTNDEPSRIYQEPA